MYLTANQLEIAAGSRRDRAECIVDTEANISPAQIQKRGVLYILTETENMANGQPRPDDIDLCKQAQEVIVREYYNHNQAATITSALREALLKANQAVFNHNSALLPPERRGLGLTVAVVRNNEIFTAQLPPTKAVLVHQGEYRILAGAEILSGIARTGTDSISSNRPQRVPALGRHTSVEPSFNRNRFEDGDVMLVCSSRFSEVLTEKELEYVLQDRESRGVLLNLSEVARNKAVTEGYALVVGMRGEFGTRSTPATVRPAGGDTTSILGRAESLAGTLSNMASRFTSGKPSEYTARSNAANSANPPLQTEETDPLAPPRVNNETNRPADAWMKRENDNVDQPAYLRNRKGKAEGGDIPPATPSGDSTFKNQQAGSFRIPPTPDKPARRDYSYTDASSDTVTGGAPPPPRPHPPAPHIEVDDEEAEGANPVWGAPKRGQQQKAFFNFGTSRPLANRPQRATRNTPAEPPNNRRSARGSTGWQLPPQLDFNGPNRYFLIGGVGLFVIVLGIILLFVFRNETVNTGKAQDRLRSAEQNRALAQQVATSNPNQARELLKTAQADLEAARKENPKLEDIQVTENAIKLTLDNINKVTVPADVRLMLDLSAQGAGVNIKKAVLGQPGDFLYLMDSGRGAIYSGDPAGGVKTILKTGDRASGATFGKPVALVARQDGIIVVDDANLAWIYNRPANQWTATTLGNSSSWNGKGLAQTASFQGNLYLIVPGISQILKYNAGLFTSPPDEWLNPGVAANLAIDKATGLAIDGTIYALLPDGKMQQMARGNKNQGEIVKTFDLKAANMVYPPLNSPIALNVGSLDFPFFFVIDAEKRVLQFSKQDGSLIQQFQARAASKEFDGLVDVLVDEVTKKIYLVGGQRVHVFNMPGSVAPNATVANPSTTIGVNTPGAGTNVTIITAGPTVRP